MSTDQSFYLQSLNDEDEKGSPIHPCLYNIWHKLLAINNKIFGISPLKCHQLQKYLHVWCQLWWHWLKLFPCLSSKFGVKSQLLAGCSFLNRLKSKVINAKYISLSTNITTKFNGLVKGIWGGIMKTLNSEIFPVKNPNLQFSGLVATSPVFKDRQIF